MNRIYWKNYTGLIQTAGSGRFVNGERLTYEQEWVGNYTDAFAAALLYPRGSSWDIYIDGTSYTMIVDESNVEPASFGSKSGFVAKLTIKFTFLGSVPPDEFSNTPFELNPPIERNPLFDPLTLHERRLARGAFQTASAEGQSTYDSRINVMEDTAHKDLVINLANKLLNGTESYYLVGLKFQHSFYTQTNPTVTTGGFIQAPFGAFSDYAPGGFGWIRQADEVIWNNGLWKVTRTWIGAPQGMFYADLYPAP
jgi:hypothetical protein